MWRTLTLRAGFNTTTVIVATTLLGVGAGLVGTFALLRKRSLMADALSHATLPGIALAFIVVTLLGGQGRSVPVLLVGGAATGVLGVLAIQLLSRHTRLTEDASIGVVLSVFFGVGVVLLSIIQSMPAGTQGGLKSFIYGQTAAMSRTDALLMGGLALLAVAAAGLLLKEFRIVCFDDQFARVAGWPVGLLDLAMMALVVCVTVAGLQAVGIILVVAMLIIPPASARFWSDRLWVVVLLSGAIGAVSGYLGASVSALLPRQPAGAVIVLTAGCVFAASLIAAPRRGLVASLIRRVRLRVHVARDHALRALHEAGAYGPEPAPGVALARLARDRGWSVIEARLIARLLRSEGLVARRAGRLTLTPGGEAIAARTVRNHRLWERYLVTHADVAPSHVDFSADMVEHVLSEPLVRELEAALAADDRAPSAGRGR